MKPDVFFGLENAGWPALLIDSGGTICRANPMAARLFGTGVEGGSAKLSAIWSPENKTNAEQFLPQWERAPVPTVPLKFRGKGGNTFAYLASLCSTSRDGQKYFVLQLLPEPAQASAEHKPAGEAKPAAEPKPASQPKAELKPVSDPKNPAEPKVSSAESSLAQKQKLECALQLARTVALDFNNALTSILGHTSLVLSQMEPQNPLRASLLEVEKSAARAAEIANDLGTFSRQEKELRAQATGNVNQLLERTVEYFQQNSEMPVVDWKLLLDRRLFAAKFDEAKLQQALLKIVENAVESLKGSGRITLQSRNVELAEPSQDRNVRLAAGAYVCAEITDNGCGIAPEILPRIFEPFFTTKRGNHRGVGLAWVYGIVTNHGGGVAVSSEPGSGTSVRVYLPAEQRTIKANGGIPADLKGDQTVLIVDDEDMLLTMGQKILTAYGYRVLTANSGQKALEMLAGKDMAVDLVITDMVMPTMSGRELLEHIQRLLPEIRVLCTSGYVLPAGQEKEDAYLQKPFTAQELLVKVKQVLTAEMET